MSRRRYVTGFFLPKIPFKLIYTEYLDLHLTLKVNKEGIVKQKVSYVRTCHLNTNSKKSNLYERGKKARKNEFEIFTLSNCNGQKWRDKLTKKSVQFKLHWPVFTSPTTIKWNIIAFLTFPCRSRRAVKNNQFKCEKNALIWNHHRLVARKLF